nr:hypothetical protein GCM10020092_083000 [Actinoplanes digitatis]
MPILWPIPIGRRMWRMVGIPNGMAVKVGGKGEVLVLRTVFTLVALLSIFGMFAPHLLNQLDLDTWADG